MGFHQFSKTFDQLNLLELLEQGFFQPFKHIY